MRLTLHKGTFLVKKAYLTSVNNDVLQFVTCMNIIGEPTMSGKESGVQWTRTLEKKNPGLRIINLMTCNLVLQTSCDSKKGLYFFGQKKDCI